MAAVVGINGTVARGLIRRFEEDDRAARIVLVDVRAPSMPIRKATFHQLDLTQPLADARLAEILTREKVERVVHLALHEVPRPLGLMGNELETVGTLCVLNAVAACLGRSGTLEHLTTVTSTMVYGADPENPNFLTEDRPLHGGARSGFVRGKIDLERQVEGFRDEQKRFPIAVLRPCWTLAPGASILARLFDQPLILTVMGFDPLIQLVHVDDLVDALKRAVDTRANGVYNIAAPSPRPLSALLRTVGRVSVPVLAPVAYPLADFLWRSYGVGLGVSLDYLRYLWVVDIERAQAELGFAPRYDTRAVAAAYAAHH